MSHTPKHTNPAAPDVNDLDALRGLYFDPAQLDKLRSRPTTPVSHTGPPRECLCQLREPDSIADAWLAADSAAGGIPSSSPTAHHPGPGDLTCKL